ncbi:hypothetical protein [Pseudomonas quebecensis]|uniref:hypothetical protein n=1 Tax=Pseudomonas quebecensis TaxID=2995174 RepID=UPI003D9C9E93
MRSLLRSWLVVVLAPFLLMTARADQEPMVLKVLGRSDVKDYQVQLNEQEWRLLRQKGSLVLGTSAPDFPPSASASAAATMKVSPPTMRS